MGNDISAERKFRLGVEDVTTLREGQAWRNRPVTTGGGMPASWAPQPEANMLENVVSIRSSADIVTARLRGRAVAAGLGFSGGDLIVIGTAISELARNMIDHATTGEIRLGQDHRNERPALVIVARDEGPGISDIPRALSAGFSTGSGLGLGLAGVRRLMDEFHMSSRLGQGTTVTVRKFLP